MNKSFLSPFRYGFIVVILLGCFFSLGCRLFYLHIWEREKLCPIVERARQKFEVIHACRGNIVERRGNLLATTRSVVDVGVDPEMVTKEDAAYIPLLSSLLHVPTEVIEKAFEPKIRKIEGPDGSEIQKVRWCKLAESVEESTYDNIKALGIKAIYANRKFQRIYPATTLAAHLLGYLNKEGKAIMGIEHYLDFYLRGQDGWRETERDGRRRELAQFRSREIAATDGFNVELTLDIIIQHFVEEQLAKIVAQYRPRSATIIVSDPSTGFLLALGNYPTFDPNEFSKYPLENQRNLALTDIYEPGSTFKIVSAAAALNEKLVHLNDLFNCNLSEVDYNGRSVNLPSDYRPLGTLSFREIMIKSSNCGISQVGVLLGADKLYEYAESFGFGTAAGLGLVGEVNGILPKVKDWDGLTISRFPIGHAIGVTPLQMHYAMSVLANQGVLMEPQVVSRIFDEKGEIVLSFNPKARRRVVSTKVAWILGTILEKTASPGGTARRAYIPGLEVAGKTGTSQKIINGRYSKNHHIASFSGYFPVKRPRVVITVVVDEAELSGVAWGGLVAAPVFRVVAEQVAQYLKIPQGGNFSEGFALQESFF